jgi:hypothetical protein
MRHAKFETKLFAQFQFFSASFGTKDHRFMWLSYANGGRGFSLGFSDELFVDTEDLDAMPLN